MALWEMQGTAEWCKAVREGAKADWEPWLQQLGKGKEGKVDKSSNINIISPVSVASVVRKVKDSAIKQLVCHIRMMLSSLEAGGLVDLVSRKMLKWRISPKLLFCVCIGQQDYLHCGIMETPF